MPRDRYRAGRPNLTHRDHRSIARHTGGRGGTRRHGNPRWNPAARRRQYRRVDQQATATAGRDHPREFNGPGRTADGQEIALLANIASLDDVTAALDYGAEGVGLYRTELCFLDRAEAPSIAEQVSVYRTVFARLAGRRVVVRTLDAGSDKALPFLGRAAEPNPTLGVRGIRTAASDPEVLHDQLQAIKEAAAAESADVWVMAPMISTVQEARSFSEVARAVGLPIVGVMIETPPAVLQAEQILTALDFVSIGPMTLPSTVLQQIGSPRVLRP
jgi:phosphoenolpyruvate-protein kinase (PTS system EI component)